MSKYWAYKTLQGDTWDSIALDFYGDEKYSSRIIQANPDYCNVLVFDANTEIKVPVIEDIAASTLPPWRR